VTGEGLRPAARAYETASEGYERGRPGYPRGAVDWLLADLVVGSDSLVVDVGAGTGRLTAELVSRVGRVVAVEPVAAMRKVLRRRVPGAEVLTGTAQALPLSAGVPDAVIAAQAFHWFDGPRALAEARRVLRRGGRLGLIWNRRDQTDPLHKALTALVDPYRGGAPSHRSGAWQGALQAFDGFGPLSLAELANRWRLDEAALVAAVVSIRFIAALPPAEREAVARRNRALFADHVAGSGTVEARYVVEIYSASRLERVKRGRSRPALVARRALPRVTW